MNEERRFKVRQVKERTCIELTLCVGEGTEKSPNRIIRQYWSSEGLLLAVHDPIIDEWIPKGS